MNIFDPLISGSLSVSGSGHVSGNLTVLGTISGTTTNAISASHAAEYTLTSSFHQFTSSYTTGSFTGSFKGDGSGLINIPASGVTGLNLNKIISGSVSASISPDNGFEINTDITVSGHITPSVDNLYDLGSPTHQWRDVYISSGSLYIDGSKVLSSTTQELTITTDNGQSLKILEGTTDSIVLQTADGNIELKSNADGDILLDPTNGKILLKGPVEVLSGQKIQSSVGGTPVVFASDIVVSGSIELTGTIEGIDLTAFSSSVNGKLFNLENDVTSLNSFTSSANLRLNGLETESGSVRTTLNNYTSSTNDRLVSIETVTGSILSTNISQTNRLDSIEGKTGSYATTGSNRFNGNQTITGSLTITDNLTVLGSSSIIYSTASQLIVEDNVIVVNASYPAERFAGLEIHDSGSNGSVTASLFWDGLHNRFIYSNTSDSHYGGGMFIAGPRNTGSLGDEPGLTNGRIPKSIGGDHIGDSIINELSGSISISGSLVITGSVLSTNTPLVSGSSQISFNGITDKPTLVSGSSQISFNTISDKPTLVSGSSQITYSSISSIPSGIVSGSSQISYPSLSNIPGGIVSGSSQIDLTATTNYSSGIKTRLNAEGVISGSSQVLSGTGIVSGSSQITLSSTTGYSSVLNQALLTTSTPTFSTVTATTFTGALSGNATSATTVTGTNIGSTAGPLSTITTQAGWAAPAGYNQMVTTSGSSGLPSTGTASPYYGYTVLSRRDAGNGYSGILIGFNNDEMWFTYNQVGSNYATWKRVWHEGNLTNLNQLTNGPGYITSSSNISGNAATATTLVSNATVSRDLYINGGTGGNFGNRLLISTTSATYTLQDTNVRPTIYMSGAYPVLTLNHTATTNTNHGPTIQFAFNGLTTGGSTSRQILIGAPGDGDHLDFGFSGGGFGTNPDNNPHNGISGYQGVTPMRLFSNGLLVGSLGSFGNVPTSITNALDVRGVSSVTRLGNTFTMSPHASGVDMHSTGNFAPHYQTSFSLYLGAIGAGSLRFNVNSSGDVTVVGTLTENSSLRYKKDVVTIKNGLDKVLRMRGVTYLKKDNDVKEVGVIAEEIGEILPDLVKYNTEGQIDSVSYGRITAVLIEAIKELKQEINDLKNNG